ncbi:MAG TPA: helix-turn-helix domain-containing protein [Acidimicrobiales bacterium]|nr:helix-turn-helix domain-containing protein [Acidimicrobiales bacterium]
MSDDVKQRFPTRAAKARQTRRAILGAARGLFVRQGFAATTIQAIADHAGVAVQTVYAAFGNKRAVLAEVLDVAIAGDEEAISVNERDWMHPVFHGPTGEARLRAYAAAVRQIHDRAADVFAVVAGAATADPEASTLHEEAERRRRTGAASVVAALTDLTPLRAGLDPEAAADVLSLLNSWSAYHHLVRRQGWTPDRFESWLGDTMVDLLLDRRRPSTRDR